MNDKEQIIINYYTLKRLQRLQKELGYSNYDDTLKYLFTFFEFNKEDTER